MSTVAVAFYARVSAEQQAQAQTIASQVAALRDHIAQVGEVLNPAHEFIDQGTVAPPSSGRPWSDSGMRWLPVKSSGSMSTHRTGWRASMPIK